MSQKEPNLSAIRPMCGDDLPALKAVIDATGLFLGEMLDAMVAPFLDGADTGEAWLTYGDGTPIASLITPPSA